MNNNQTRKRISSSDTHRTLQKSSTLNRRYVKKPQPFTSQNSVTQTTSSKTPSTKKVTSESPDQVSIKIDSTAKSQSDILKRRQAIADQINKERLSKLRKFHPNQTQASSQTQSHQAEANLENHIPELSLSQSNVSNLSSTPSTLQYAKSTSFNSSSIKTDSAKVNQLTNSVAKRLKKPEATRTLTALELKEQAIQKALANMDSSVQYKKSKKQIKSSKVEKKSTNLGESFKKTGKIKRAFIAFSCATACILALTYIVYTNVPGLPVQVTAMQSGIDANYPSYIPQGFQLTSVSATKNKSILITFSDKDNQSFLLSEEKSSWDSTALLHNFVKTTYKDDFLTMREQGITIFVNNSNATWVNGGILYKITADTNLLSKTQIKDIATSL